MKKQSRREFLKASGTILLVFSGGLTFPLNTAAQSIPQRGASGIPLSEGYILVDVNKCQGCLSCMLACSLVHEGIESLSLSRIQILQNPFKFFPADVKIEQCRQCVDPACVKACPTGAMEANPSFGHVRMVDPHKCIGCGHCYAACPHKPAKSVIHPRKEVTGKKISRKCDLCSAAPYHWEQNGGGPKGRQACVEVCPVGAIRFTDKMPVQDGETGYRVNLRDSAWARLGYPVD